MTSSVPELFVDLGNVSDHQPGLEHAPAWNLARVPRIVLVAVVALLLLGSAAPPPRSMLTLVAEAMVGTNAQIIIDGDRMYVDSYDLRNTLSAYDLRSHRRLWSTDQIEQPGEGLLLIGPTIVASSYNGSPGSTNTEAIDVTTGRLLWTSENGNALGAGRGVLLQTPLAPDAFQTGFGNPTGYHLVDPRTGRVIWSIRVPDGCVTTLTGTRPADLLIEACVAADTIRTIDLADGRTVAQRSAPLGSGVDPAIVDPSEQMTQPQLVVVGGTLLIAHANVPVPTVDAYALDTLASRWGGLGEQFAQGISACGHEICFYQTPEVGIRVDVATGRSLGPADPMPGDDQVPVPEGTLLAVGSDGKAAAVIPTGPEGEAEFIQPDGTGTVWLARRSGRLIGPLLRSGRSACEQFGPYVACATTDDRIRVWNVAV
jgi:hypothetical protein